MKQSVWVFCLGSGLGFASGFSPLIKTGNSGGKVIAKEEVGRMHKYGTGSTGVCLGYRLKDGEIAREADKEKQEVKLVFWFQKGNADGCKELATNNNKTEEIKKQMKENGYWRVTMSKRELNGNLEAMKWGNHTDNVWNCLNGNDTQSNKKQVCDMMKTLAATATGKIGKGMWEWVKGSKN